MIQRSEVPHGNARRERARDLGLEMPRSCARSRKSCRIMSVSICPGTRS